ncbi:MAG: manganese-dependent inorganic pyrophosphatase [Rhodobacteraceae bacterium]|nr:manganese-dependent inorganic pyrophosphatase [Paracoccaceae bacterium]MCY4197625.1 manganese-dependent inorganic pyrophosphatase [Paracoccaceae bacterium]
MALIFGHKSPDSDATGAPLIWQWQCEEIAHRAAEAVLLGAPSKEARFMLDQWGFSLPRTISDVEDGEDVIIVDTNNPGELPKNILNANIIEIIDHHLLSGGLATKIPIPVTIRPLASTATVMCELLGTNIDRMPRPLKGIALSCILSDTLEFRSPTTTKTDRLLAANLAAELRVDIPSFAAEMFAAKSDMSDYSDAELLTIDSKFYEIDGCKLRVSVLETTTPAVILDRRSGLTAAMETAARNEGIDQILLFVVDILNTQATLLTPNQFTRELAERSFSATATGDTVLLPGIVSRKKQILPNLKP